jgi:drug/metabolite transporter (DMT)-like permease
MTPVRTSGMGAVIAMVLSSGLLTANDALSKHLADSLSIGQIIFFRQFGVVVLLSAFVGAAGQMTQFRVTNWSGQVLRGGVFVVSMFTIVQALVLFPLPLVSVGLFSSPIATALLSAPLLGEAVGLRRWMAALLGFAGALVIIRPGAITFSWLALLPFVPALTVGLMDILTRRLTRTESPLSILLCSNIIITLAALVALLLAGEAGWRPVTSEAAGWLILNAMLNLGAHFFMIQALRMGDAAFVAPFKYTGLIWAFLIGLLWWGYVPDVWTVAGSLLIVVSGLVALAQGRSIAASQAPEITQVRQQNL